MLRLGASAAGAAAGAAAGCSLLVAGLGVSDALSWASVLSHSLFIRLTARLTSRVVRGATLVTAAAAGACVSYLVTAVCNVGVDLVLASATLPPPPSPVPPPPPLDLALPRASRAVDAEIDDSTGEGGAVASPLPGAGGSTCRATGEGGAGGSGTTVAVFGGNDTLGLSGAGEDEWLEGWEAVLPPPP